MPDVRGSDAEESEGDAMTPAPYYQPLFDHMLNAHGLTLLDSEMDEIVLAVEAVKARGA